MNPSVARIAALLFLCAGCAESGGSVMIARTPPDRVSAPGNATCSGKTISAGGRTYCILPEVVAFAGAEGACGRAGMHPAYIETAEENAALQEALAPMRAGEFWIGLLEPQEGHWLWASEREPQFGAWGPGEPNDSGGENCAEIVTGTGLWNDASCERAIPYVCQSRVVEDPDRPRSFSCTGDLVATAFGTYCFYRNSPRTWQDAEKACVATGGTLAELTTAAELGAFNRAIAAKVTSASLWIGATDRTAEGTFRWTSGEPLVFSGFGPGEPNDANSDEDCTEWYAASGVWNDLACSTPRAVLCEAPAALTVVASHDAR